MNLTEILACCGELAPRLASLTRRSFSWWVGIVIAMTVSLIIHVIVKTRMTKMLMIDGTL